MDAMRVGVIGAGGMGRVHCIQYAKMEDVDLYIYDRNREWADNFAEAFEAEVCGTYSELVREVDIVDICIPTHLHCEAALLAMEAGCHVVSEKPLASSSEECQNMIDGAKQHGVKLMPAQVVRYFAEHEAAHNAIKSGAVGKPASVRLRRGGTTPIGSSEWFTKLDKSGGVLLDVAVHDMDWLLWTIGPVKTVYARSIRWNGAVRDDSFRGDYASVTFTHENGCISNIEATWLDPLGFHAGIEVSGSEGSLEFFHRDNPPLKLSQDGQPASVGRPNLPTDDPYYRELRAFVDAVKNDTDPPIMGDEGKAAVELALASLESAKTGQAVHL